jgi:predicted Zn-dependent peptidase
MDRTYIGVKNRHATNLLFEATQPMQLAQRLCFFENAGALDDINNEQSLIESFSLNDVLTVSKQTIDANSVSVIYYHPKK